MLKKKVKDIKCYSCGKKGKAKLVLRYMTFGKTKDMKETKGKWVWTWRAKDFKMLNLNLWLCSNCDKHNKCKSCGIILSNKIVCRCKVKHGAFYSKHPKYCKGCWDELHPTKI